MVLQQKIGAKGVSRRREQLRNDACREAAAERASAQVVEHACPGAVSGTVRAPRRAHAVVRPDRLVEVCRFLAGPPLAFGLLGDLSCADFPERARALPAGVPAHLAGGGRACGCGSGRARRTRGADASTRRLADRQLARARGLRHLRHAVPRPPGPRADPDAATTGRAIRCGRTTRWAARRWRSAMPSERPRRRPPGTASGPVETRRARPSRPPARGPDVDGDRAGHRPGRGLHAEEALERTEATPARRSARAPRAHGHQHGPAAPLDPRRAAPDRGARRRGRASTCTRSSATSTPASRSSARTRRTGRCVTLIDRMDYLAPFANNHAYRWPWSAAGHRGPAARQVLRVLLCELNRIAATWCGSAPAALDLGAISVFFYAYRERDKALDLFEMISGERMNDPLLPVGRLRATTCRAGFEPRMRDVHRRDAGAHRRVRGAALAATRSGSERTEGRRASSRPTS